MDLHEGSIVAERFRLEEELGRGGMGAVWRAKHEALDMPCAVKFIHAQAASRDELRDRFRREAQSAAKLRSPFVVQMLDFGVWEDFPYIAMELLEGESLGERLERRGPISLADTVAIAHDVGQALEAARGHGIVHRDLKPDNIFLVNDTAGVVAKVLDFGIAKMGEGMHASQLTRTGALLGTPHYMSPEQAHGAKTVDHRSDLWSLAVVVYQCIVGRRPFEGEALGELICNIMGGSLPVPSEQKPGLPRSFDQWWQRAAAREPDQRFASAPAMVEALRSALFPQSSVDTALTGSRLADLGGCDTDPLPEASPASTLHVEVGAIPTVSASTLNEITSDGTFEGTTFPPSDPPIEVPSRKRWGLLAIAAVAGMGAGLTTLGFTTQTESAGSVEASVAAPGAAQAASPPPEPAALPSAVKPDADPARTPKPTPSASVDARRDVRPAPTPKAPMKTPFPKKAPVPKAPAPKAPAPEPQATPKPAPASDPLLDPGY